MTITQVSTYILQVPLNKERFYSSQCAFPQRKSLLVRVDTDEGLSGWGEGGQYGPGEPVAACIQDVFAPMLIGRRPDPVRLWEELYAFSRDFGQKGSYVEALSAIDIALWDLLGQETRQPVHRLLGGSFRDSIGAYATGCYYRGSDHLDFKAQLPALAEEADGYIKQGFSILKIKVGLLPVEDDIERVRSIRDRIGPKPVLLVDANHAYNVFNAIRVGRELENFNVQWFEEPVIPEDKSGYRRVRDTIRVPIAGGEAEYTRYGFRDLFEMGCVDIAQPDLTVCGGFSELQKILALASAFGVWVIPHVWGSGVALAAALQVLATLPPFPHTANPVLLQNEPIVEYDRNRNPLRDDLLKEPLRFESGKLLVPRGPGLGVTVNQEVLGKYCRTSCTYPVGKSK